MPMNSVLGASTRATLLAAVGAAAIGCAALQDGLDSLDARSAAEPASETAAAAPAPAAPAEAQPAPRAEEPAQRHEVASPVRATLDGSPDKAADQFGIVWDIDGRVSSEPFLVVEVDESLGAFQRLIINVYEAGEDGTETGGAWAITDFGGEQILLPGRRFNLSNPGAVTIISPEGAMVDSVPFVSGKSYIALLVVSGSESAHTHKIRFAVR